MPALSSWIADEKWEMPLVDIPELKAPSFCPPYVLFNQRDATMAGHEAP